MSFQIDKDDVERYVKHWEVHTKWNDTNQEEKLDILKKEFVFMGAEIEQIHKDLDFLKEYTKDRFEKLDQKIDKLNEKFDQKIDKVNDNVDTTYQELKASIDDVMDVLTNRKRKKGLFWPF